MSYQSMSNRNEIGDFAAMLGLKGSRRVVLEEVHKLLSMKETVSVMKVAFLTGYCNTTVWRAMKDLRELSLLDMQQDKSGAPATYTLTIEV